MNRSTQPSGLEYANRRPEPKEPNGPKEPKEPNGPKGPNAETKSWLLTYYTHDNGGRPFEVRIDSQKVSVYKKSPYYDEDEYTTLVKAFTNVKRIFIGKSPKNSRTKFSGGYGKEFDGNTILLYLGSRGPRGPRGPSGTAARHRYVYVGEKIFSFTTDHRITKYVSPVGSNDVPYPYAVDKNNVHYLLAENVFLKIDSSGARDDPYSYFYDVRRITPDTGSAHRARPIFPNFDGIEEFLIDDETYTLTYHSDPEAHYEFIKSELGRKACVIKTNGKKVELDKKRYVDLMRRFGKLIQASAIHNVKIVHGRL